MFYFNYKKRAKEMKKVVSKYFIPNLTIIHDGEKLPVVTGFQADYEWSLEFGRAELMRRVAIVEFIIIIALIVRCIAI
ncbi:MAG: hypothetical protein E7309_16175 [Butyrivibrio sp.]|jgi:hypothetical protein|nr:hypothetical protein [Butyrivibrio sp.]